MEWRNGPALLLCTDSNFTSSLLVTVMLKMLALIRGAGKYKVCFTFPSPTSIKRQSPALCLLGCQWFALLITTIRKMLLFFTPYAKKKLHNYADLACYSQEASQFLGCSDESIAALRQNSCFYIPGANRREIKSTQIRNFMQFLLMQYLEIYLFL